MSDTLMFVSGVFPFIIIIFSIVLHEIAHGYAAYSQGDQTAYREGRLTINPLSHIDMMGSVIVPLFAFFTAGTFFGWAKPVPYNEYNIRSKYGVAFVAAAGVLANLLTALIAGIIFKILLINGTIDVGVSKMLYTIIGVNVSLAFFNLIPVPPFDGMSILQALFPRLNIKSRIVYNPAYMIFAIVIASVLYGFLAPHLATLISFLLF